MMKLLILIFICFLFITNDLVESRCKRFSSTLCAPCARYRIYKGCSICVRKLNRKKCCFNPLVALRANVKSLCQSQTYNINRCSKCKRNKNQSVCFKCIRRLNRSNKCYNSHNRYALHGAMVFCERQSYYIYRCRSCKYLATQNSCVNCVKQFNGLFNCYNPSQSNVLRSVRRFCKPRYYLHYCNACKQNNNQSQCIKCVKKMNGPYKRCYKSSDPSALRKLRVFCKPRAYNISRCRYCKRYKKMKCIQCVRNANRYRSCYNPQSQDDLLIVRLLCDQHNINRCNKCKRYKNPSSCYTCVRRMNRSYSCYDRYDYNGIVKVRGFCNPGTYDINRCRQCTSMNNQIRCFKCFGKLNKSNNCYNSSKSNYVREVRKFCKPSYVYLHQCNPCKRYNNLNRCINCVRQMKRAQHGCYKSGDKHVLPRIRVFCKPQIININVCSTCKRYNNVSACVKCVKQMNYQQKCYNRYNRNDLRRVREFCTPQKYDLKRCRTCKQYKTQYACINCVRQMNRSRNCFDRSDGFSARRVRQFCKHQNVTTYNLKNRHKIHLQIFLKTN